MKNGKGGDMGRGFLLGCIFAVTGNEKEEEGRVRKGGDVGFYKSIFTIRNRDKKGILGGRPRGSKLRRSIWDGIDYVSGHWKLEFRER